MARIELTGGLFALVDEGDLDWLIAHRWQPLKRPQSSVTYASRIAQEGGRRKNLLMHREIAKRAGLEIEGKQVDHVNGDGLDNRRANLRSATVSQNSQNRKRKRDGCSSRFKGVYWDRLYRKWFAAIYVTGKRIKLGSFSSETDAAQAYAKAARIYFGEFAAPTEAL